MNQGVTYIKNLEPVPPRRTEVYASKWEHILALMDGIDWIGLVNLLVNIVMLFIILRKT
jgi:hypothetical protein